VFRLLAAILLALAATAFALGRRAVRAAPPASPLAAAPPPDTPPPAPEEADPQSRLS
jgi:hypothetical protein